MFCRFFTFSLLQLQGPESLICARPRKNLVSIGSLHGVPVTSYIKNVLPCCLTLSVSTCSSMLFVQLVPRQNFQKYPSPNQRSQGVWAREEPPSPAPGHSYASLVFSSSEMGKSKGQDIGSFSCLSCLCHREACCVTWVTYLTSLDMSFPNCKTYTQDPIQLNV